MSGTQFGLNFKAKSMLKALGFKDPETINTINMCSWLSGMINNFVSEKGGSDNVTGTFGKITDEQSTYRGLYNPNTNVIWIHNNAFNTGVEGERDHQYQAVLTLAHELGHSISMQYKYDYTTIETAAYTSKMWEGVTCPR